MRVTDVAARLGVSVSTAHRLLGMLVYRDFAEQLPDRRYGAGPVLRGGPVQQASVAALREVALPHLRGLVDALGETANVMVLAGPDVRFVATVECDHVLRVGDRTGRVAAGAPQLRRQGGAGPLGDRGAGRRPRAPGRRDGGAAGSGSCAPSGAAGSRSTTRTTEAGLTAVGVAVPPAGGFSGAALSVAAPTARYSRDRLPVWGAALAGAAAAIARDLGAG